MCNRSALHRFLSMGRCPCRFNSKHVQPYLLPPPPIFLVINSFPRQAFHRAPQRLVRTKTPAPRLCQWTGLGGRGRPGSPGLARWRSTGAAGDRSGVCRTAQPWSLPADEQRCHSPMPCPDTWRTPRQLYFGQSLPRKLFPCPQPSLEQRQPRTGQTGPVAAEPRAGTRWAIGSRAGSLPGPGNARPGARGGHSPARARRRRPAGRGRRP